MPNTSFAHPGNTASDGCHYCRTNCDKWGEEWDTRHCHGGVANTPSPTTNNFYAPSTSKPLATSKPQATTPPLAIPTAKPTSTPETTSTPTPIITNNSEVLGITENTQTESEKVQSSGDGGSIVGLLIFAGLGYLGLKKYKDKKSNIK